MKKLLLTESQAKLLMEEIDKNDSIQKLLFNCDNISLLYNEDNNGEINISFQVDSKNIDDKIISLKLNKTLLHNEALNKDYTVFDCKFFLNESICNLEVESKILSKIIQKGYSPILLKLKNTNCSIEDIVNNFDTIPLTNNNEDILGYIIKK